VVIQLPVNYKSLSYKFKRQVREEYVKRQEGLCYHCNQPLDKPPHFTQKINWKLFPPNFDQYPIHLHHSHVTGMTIGAVHAYCNAVLWQYHGE